MKNIYVLICILLITSPLMAMDFYVDAKNGNDKNDGQSEKTAFQSIKRVNELKLKAGDKLLFANGYVYEGSLILRNRKGGTKGYIEVSNYSSKQNPSEELPHIDGKGYKNAILIENSSFIRVNNLKLSANGGFFPSSQDKKQNMRCGLLFLATNEGVHKNIELKNLKVTDVFLMKEGHTRGKKEVFTPNGTQGYGWGIRVLSKNNKGKIKNVKIDNCEVKNVAHTGIKVNGKGKNIEKLEITNCLVFESGGPGMQMSGIVEGLVASNIINYSGNNSDSRKWGRGSGLWTWGCDYVLIEHNEFRNANGPADSAGCHIDFNCSNVIVQFNISENNAGGFCEILGNNYNCAYRYNVSINDGHRVKKKGVASQEGKIFWLSGFNGKGRDRKGPFNSYFYNNTIYVKEGQQAKIAVDRASKGALIANNIFYIEGTSKQVLGDQYKPEVEGESLIENIVFKNNLFLKHENWPKEATIQDESPFYGDPEFVNKKGNQLGDFIPKNKSLVKDKGIEIQFIPDDKKGLYIGLQVEKDILGNPIVGKPDIGAIQFEEKYSKAQ